VLAIGVVLLDLIYQRPWVELTRTVMIDATILLTIISGFHYAWVASKRIGRLADTDIHPNRLRDPLGDSDPGSGRDPLR
jgi:hypothetical protein